AAIPEKTEPVVVARALREHLRDVDIVAGIVAQNADAAGKEGARSHGRALRAAQAAAAVIAVGGTARRVAVVARGVPQETEAAGEAEALAPGVEFVAVVAAEVDQHADAERRHALRGVRRAIAVVAGEIENERGAGQRGAET